MIERQRRSGKARRSMFRGATSNADWVRSEKRHQRRRARQLARGRLRALDASGEPLCNVGRASQGARVVIQRRRKLNPFVRWCAAHTRGMADEHIVDFVRDILRREAPDRARPSYWEEIAARLHACGECRAG